MQIWSRSRLRLALLGSAAMLVVAGGAIDLGTTGASAQATAPLQTTSAAAPASFADLVARVRPAVVSVTVRIKPQQANLQSSSFVPDGRPMQHFAQPQLQRPGAPARQEVMVGLGSGFLISPDGYIVTNNHVVNEASSVRVTMANGHNYKAKVIGTDPKTDLALLKIDVANAPFVKFANTTPRVGDWVVAVGNPYGLPETVTAGIVSARGRDIGADTYDDYLQIDAPINKGNSGGPAFDSAGDVVGVNTAIFSPSGGSVGIGFDIPSDTARKVIAQLKAHGHADHGYLGVEVQALTPELAESMGIGTPHGVIIDAARQHSAAAHAGLKAGDVVTAVDGKAVKDPAQFARTIGMMSPHNKVTLTVLHNGQDRQVAVSLGTLPT